MKTLRTGLLLLVLLGASAEAKNVTKSQSNGVAQLRNSLKVIASAETPNSATPKTIDKDQGDDHASLNAIQNVCSKSTPAARRSAICPISASPQ